ncbi:hypothetical protein LJR098_001036 [Rhizobium sp. LjRoot98]|uniref:hypothetical protein n=1 Tax=unclassified Rhizobium TaxID=2613769 RepID=UPI000713329F|nr:MULTISPECIES: hypothetical protein [unclassified Rhizobium]KQV41893.1 hypothetical protein ASC96_00575 [Rhizobium sp. Root1204]KQY17821.1 hypothetical protein ASD36_04165 [Rhizobium sp. Root1334]KRC13684.1 hypothetical protein ASE23_04165 [Rhizobium sp. Root73]
MQDNNDQTRKHAATPAAPSKLEAGKLEPGHEAERQAEARRERAAKTLRDNLLRRKQQGRARRAGAADETSGLPAAKTDESAE